MTTNIRRSERSRDPETRGSGSERELVHLLPRAEAAIDHQAVTGHITGGVGSKKHQRTYHLTRLGHPRQWDSSRVTGLEGIVLTTLPRPARQW